ncbi:MAG: hypothetical protein M1118_01075 [Chloroflexi bacterium]|nr:hypothetical protein [Chloroflexota bacterium]
MLCRTAGKRGSICLYLIAAISSFTAGSSLEVDAGWGTLRERTNWASPGKSWVIGGGLREEHLSALWRWGYRQFHVGRAARHDGQWSSHVEQRLVRVWRDHLDDLAQTRW